MLAHTLQADKCGTDLVPSLNVASEKEILCSSHWSTRHNPSITPAVRKARLTKRHKSPPQDREPLQHTHIICTSGLLLSNVRHNIIYLAIHVVNYVGTGTGYKLTCAPELSLLNPRADANWKNLLSRIEKSWAHRPTLNPEPET